MAVVVKTPFEGAYVTALTDLTLAPGTIITGDTIALKKGDFVICSNPGASADVTFTSQATTRSGRIGDITTDTILTDEIHFWGPAELDGWADGSGDLNVVVTNASILLGVITAP